MKIKIIRIFNGSIRLLPNLYYHSNKIILLLNINIYIYIYIYCVFMFFQICY